MTIPNWMPYSLLSRLPYPHTTPTSHKVEPGSDLVIFCPSFLQGETISQVSPAQVKKAQSRRWSSLELSPAGLLGGELALQGEDSLSASGFLVGVVRGGHQRVRALPSPVTSLCCCGMLRSRACLPGASASQQVGALPGHTHFHVPSRLISKAAASW